MRCWGSAICARSPPASPAQDEDLSDSESSEEEFEDPGEGALGRVESARLAAFTCDSGAVSAEQERLLRQLRAMSDDDDAAAADDDDDDADLTEEEEAALWERARQMWCNGLMEGDWTEVA